VSTPYIPHKRLLTHFPSPGMSEPDENPWEFDTVRGRSFDASGLGSPQVTVRKEQASATIKPPSSKLPTSLRHLFDDDATSAPDPFRIPGFSTAGKDAASGIPASPVLPPSPATPLPIVRDRAARRALRIENSHEDVPNLSTATFAFPPRTITRAAKAKVGTGLSDDQVGSVSSNPGHADKPSTVPSSSPPENTVAGSTTPVLTSLPPKVPARRDVRLDSGDPDLEALTQGSGHEMNLLTAANDDGSLSDSKLVPALSRRSPSRNRSQSTAQFLPPTSAQEQTLSLPDFHFPQNSSDFNQSLATSSGPGYRPRARMSPIQVHAPNTQIFLHNPTHSLDARNSTGSPQRPSPPSLAPPVVGRSRSATPGDDTSHDAHVGPLPGGLKLQRRPSLHRLASLTGMETSPSSPQAKHLWKSVRGRSGNSAGGVGDLSGIPDLKDVLKVSLLRFFRFHC